MSTEVQINGEGLAAILEAITEIQIEIQEGHKSPEEGAAQIAELTRMATEPQEMAHATSHVTGG